MRSIIALTGPKGCGKSTAAKLLIDIKKFHRHSFAKPLKEMIKCLGVDERHVNGELKEIPCEELCGKSPRFGMQTIGTEWGRDIMHPNLWVNAWKNTLPEGNVVCDDLRFPNELVELKKMGGTIIEISRPGFERDQSHESEAHSLPYDYKIENNGSFDDLIIEIQKTLDKINS